MELRLLNGVIAESVPNQPNAAPGKPASDACESPAGRLRGLTTERDVRNEVARPKLHVGHLLEAKGDKRKVNSI